MKEMIRMVVVLSVITALSGFVLSGLKQWTDPIIEVQVLNNVQGPALRQIFPDCGNDPIADRRKMALPGSEQEVTVFPVMSGGKLRAVAMEAGGKGYGGMVNVMVGFEVATGRLVGICVTTHKETPGLGTRVAEPAFTKQFKGKEPAKAALKKDGGDIDAVSGATYSSIGAATAVRQASEWYAALKDQITTAW